MICKVVSAVVTIVLVACLTSAIIRIIQNNNAEEEFHYTPHAKAAQSICQATADKACCLTSLLLAKSDDPEVLIKALALAAFHSLQIAIPTIDNVSHKVDGSNYPKTKAALDYCKKVLDYATLDIRSFVDGIGNDVNNLSHKFYSLRQWITRVWIYQSDCLEYIEVINIKHKIENEISLARRQTGNTIDVMNNLAIVLKDFNITFTLPETQLTPSNTSATPSDNSSSPSNTSATPSDNSSSPSNTSATPSDNSLSPSNTSATPSNTSATPSNMSATPSDMSATPSDNSSSPSNTSATPSNTSATSPRTLLEEVEKEEYPTWMSRGDRKLLQAVGTKQTTPSVVVAKDGSGQFTTISEAVAAYPNGLKGRYIIYVKAGIYQEQVVIPKSMPNVMIYGDGPRLSVIANDKHVYDTELITPDTGTLQVDADGFLAKFIGVQNNAGPDGQQAVALRIHGDKAAVFNSRIDGFQNTLFAACGRQFYRNCVISGTVDFIFGTSLTVIQNSLILVRKGAYGQTNVITAEGSDRGKDLHTGIVIQNCQIVADRSLATDTSNVVSYLGRPWKPFATVVIMESQIGEFIHNEGWLKWEGKPLFNRFHESCNFMEYSNSGPGSKTEGRVEWAGYKAVTDPKDVEGFTVIKHLAPANWIQVQGVPLIPGFVH